MNGRIKHEPTPHGRLAAVAWSTANNLCIAGKKADYADYATALRLFVEREIILVRIEEIGAYIHQVGESGAALKSRVAKLSEELQKVDAEIISKFKHLL